MAGKYDSETYSITTFDKRGAKVEKIPLGNIGLIRAKEVGFEMVRNDTVASFAIERVCFNSLDNAESWLPRAGGRFSDGHPYRQED
jgi:hypothetical protein